MNTPIADMVDAMIARGATAEMIALAVRGAELSRDMSQGQSRDIRRETDRLRKQIWRQKSSKNNEMPEANDAGMRAGVSPKMSQDMSQDAADKRCNLSSFLADSPSGIQEARKKKRTVVVEGQKRGTRLTPDARMTEDDRKFAAAHGVEPDQTWAEFVDYWIAIPGQRGTKLNWSATYRNRVRAIASRKKPNGSTGNVIAAADRLIERIRKFDEAPSDVCGREGADVVRLLPKG